MAWWKPFRDAFAGIGFALRTQRNMRRHLAATAVVCAFGLGLKIAAVEWLLILLAIGLVIAGELFNTAIEQLADRITTTHDDFIRHAKDTAAGAVLTLAITAAAIGLFVFVPRLWTLLQP